MPWRTLGGALFLGATSACTVAPQDCVVALSILDQLLVPRVPIDAADWDSDRSLCLTDFYSGNTQSCAELEWTPAGIEVDRGMTIADRVGSGPFAAAGPHDDEEPLFWFDLYDARRLAFAALPDSEGLVAGDIVEVSELDVTCDTFSARLAFRHRRAGDPEAVPSTVVTGGTGWIEVEVPTVGEGEFRVPSIQLGLRIDRPSVCPGTDLGSES